jgi:hypothetical protein
VSHRSFLAIVDNRSIKMRKRFFTIVCIAATASLLSILGSKVSFAAYCPGGQQPAPPALAAQMALPLCGFAASQDVGSNGCQLCDARGR